MKTRIIAGLCMAPLLIILYFGGVVLALATMLIALVGVTEFYNGWEALEVKPSKTIAYCMIVVLFVLHFANYFGLLGSIDYSKILMLWVVLAIAVSCLYGWDIVKRGPYDAMATMLGLVYVVFFSYHIVLIDGSPYPLFIWCVVIAAFGSDIMAYFTGYFLGKHKLAPNLSPKKTIEGAVGGVVGAGLFCGLFAFVFMPKSLLIHAIVIGFIGGAVSQAGDLTASAFKRKMGIKDYGKLIPGHGGIMDRFDSVIFTAPFVYYYIVMFLGA